MNAILQFQIPLTLWLQSLSPALDRVFIALNFFQSVEFFLLVLPVIWWCVDKRLGASLAIIFLTSDHLVRSIKDFTALPRPYQLDPRVRGLDPQTDSSFPSAAVMAHTILWGYLATQFKTRAWWIWAAVAIFLMSLTRVYLGVHYPTDALGSIILGSLILFLVLRSNLVARVIASPRIWQWALAIAAPLILGLLHLTHDTAVDMGAVLGFSVGVILEADYVRFDPRATWLKQLLKLIIGFGIALGIRFALKAILPEQEIFDLARYAVLGLWLGFGAPWVFVKVRLAGKEI